MEEEKQCRIEASNPGNFARVAKFPNPCKVKFQSAAPTNFHRAANLDAPVDFFCTLFDLFQICPYAIVIIF